MTSTSAKEKAVDSLLKPPAVRYIRSLKRSVDRDPAYLDTHREDIGNIIIGLLSGSGFHWDRKIFEREWNDILQRALDRIARKQQ